jgi:hypothetical protein
VRKRFDRFLKAFLRKKTMGLIELPCELRKSAEQLRAFPSVRTAREFGDKGIRLLDGGPEQSYRDGYLRYTRHSLHDDSLVLVSGGKVLDQAYLPLRSLGVSRMRGAGAERAPYPASSLHGAIRALKSSFTKDVSMVMIDDTLTWL